jgi:hypothetical protein
MSVDEMNIAYCTFYILFICGLFNDVFQKQDYTASNEWVIRK